MNKKCSALLETGGCKNGHSVTQGCYGTGYPHGKVVPVCVNENKKFDESRGVVTIANWKGE